MSTPAYITAEELKKSLTMSGTTFADYDIDPAIAAASQAINELCGRRRFDIVAPSVDEVRYYKPSNAEEIVINDLVAITSLETDQDSDGAFEQTWVNNQDYFLWPYNALADDRPYTRIKLNTGKATVGFPNWAPRGAKVTGKFGWPVEAPFLNPAAKILASKLIKRVREAPFGVVTVGLDVGSAIRIGRMDPDVQGLLDPYTREVVI